MRSSILLSSEAATVRSIMSLTKRLLIRLVRLSAYCVLVFSASAYAELNDEQKRKFEEVKRNIERIKSELEKTKGSRDELQKTLENNEKAIQKLDTKTKQIKKDLEQKQSRLEELREEQVVLSKKKNEQANLVSDYINAAYRLGQHSQIRMLLNQQDPAQVSRMLKYYEAFSESRAEKIQIFVSTLERLKEIEPEIAYEKNQVQRTYATLKKEQQALRTSQTKRQSTLAKLESELKDQTQKLAGLQADRRRLEKLLSQVYEEINAQELSIGVSEFAQLKGALPWPAKGKTLNRYGRNRIGSQLKWQGLEIAASLGSDVIAVHHGQVVFSDYLRGHGLLLVIDHGDGYMSLYAHNGNLYKDLGEWVESGEVIASVGNTGGRTDTALYFELRHNGQPTNPAPWFRRA